MVKAGLMTPSSSLKVHVTMTTRELEEMRDDLLKRITHHNHCRRHRISIPKEGKQLEKTRWMPTLSLLVELIREQSQNSTTRDNSATGFSPSTITPRKIASKQSQHLKKISCCFWSTDALSAPSLLKRWESPAPRISKATFISKRLVDRKDVLNS